MLAQRLRHLITIQERATSLNAYLENTGSWATWRTAYASVEQVSGREFQAMAALHADANVRIVCRHEDVDGVTPQMRVSFDNRVFDIVEVRNLRERDRIVYLICRVSTDPDNANAVTADGEIVTAGGETVTAT